MITEGAQRGAREVQEAQGDLKIVRGDNPSYFALPGVSWPSLAPSGPLLLIMA